MLGLRKHRAFLFVVALTFAWTWSLVAGSQGQVNPSDVNEPSVEPLPPKLLRAHDAPRVEGEADLDAAIEHMAAIVRNADDPGISIAIIENGKTSWMGGFGRARRGEHGERAVQADADPLYRVGSISKSFISLTASRLSADGRLDLEQPLDEIVPDLDYENAYRDEQPITVAHLLEHTSAFDELRFNEMIASDEEAGWELSKVLELNPRSRVARWRPGTRHAYSQVGYTVAARALEASARRDWESLVRDEVFEPLGIHHASYAYTDDVKARLAYGYDGPDNERRPMWHLHHRPGGNLFLSVRDMSRAVEMFIARGQAPNGDPFLPESVLRRMEHGQTLPIAEGTPAYGLGIYPLQFHGDLFYGHGGWMPGYNGHFAYSPERKIGVVVFGNHTGPTQRTEAVWRVAAVAIDYLDRKYPPPEPRPGVKLPEYEMEALTGYYRFNSPAVALNGVFARLHRSRHVYIQDGELWVKTEGFSREKLVPRSARTFSRQGERFPSIAFHVDARGDVVMYDMDWGHSSYQREGTALHHLIGLWFVLSNLLIFLSALTVFVWAPALLLRYTVSDLAFVSVSGWAIIGMFYFMAATPVDRLGDMNAMTLALFACTWGFAISTLLSLRAAWRAWRPKTLASQHTFLFRAVCTLVALVWLSWLVMLASEGLIGLRTWAW